MRLNKLLVINFIAVFYKSHAPSQTMLATTGFNLDEEKLRLLKIHVVIDNIL